MALFYTTTYSATVSLPWPYETSLTGIKQEPGLFIQCVCVCLTIRLWNPYDVMRVGKVYNRKASIFSYQPLRIRKRSNVSRDMGALGRAQ